MQVFPKTGSVWKRCIVNNFLHPAFVLCGIVRCVTHLCVCPVAQQLRDSDFMAALSGSVQIIKSSVIAEPSCVRHCEPFADIVCRPNGEAISSLFTSPQAPRTLVQSRRRSLIIASVVASLAGFVQRKGRRNLIRATVIAGPVQFSA